VLVAAFEALAAGDAWTRIGVSVDAAPDAGRRIRLLAATLSVSTGSSKKSPVPDNRNMLRFCKGDQLRTIFFCRAAGIHPARVSRAGSLCPANDHVTDFANDRR